MGRRFMIKTNPALEYACYKIIQRYKDPQTDKVDGIRFNKMISLLNQKLLNSEEERLDIKLPHCWYFYGDMVILRDMPKQLRMDHKDDEPISKVYWEGPQPKISKKIKKIIDKREMTLQQEYPPNCDINIVIEKVYSYAPYEFQRDFLIFRNDNKFLPQEYFKELHQKILKGDFKNNIKHYPYERFPELKVQFTKISYIIETIFNEYPDNNQMGIDLGNKFWKIFCKYLVLDEKGNYNASKDAIDHWKKIAVKDLIEYNKQLNDDIKTFFKEFNTDSLDDPLLKAFLQPDDWGEGTEKISSEIDDILYS